MDIKRIGIKNIWQYCKFLRRQDKECRKLGIELDFTIRLPFKRPEAGGIATKKDCQHVNWSKWEFQAYIEGMNGQLEERRCCYCGQAETKIVKAKL